MKPKIGLQLYAVRDLAQEDLPGTLEKVAALGFRAVEFPSFFGWGASAVRSHLDRLGMTAISGFAMLDELTSRLDQTIAFITEVGGSYVVCPWAEFADIAAIRQTAALFNRIGAACRDSDLAFCYHHHEHEFAQYDGECGLDVLLRETDPELVKLEFDTCNAMVAGVDPVEYLTRHATRCPIVHLKDHVAGQPRGSVELGRGELDIAAAAAVAGVTGTAADSGVKWLVVEQESSTLPSLESVRVARHTLVSLGIM